MAFRPELERWLFPPAARARLERRAELVTSPLLAVDWQANRAALANAEILIGSWGIPTLTSAVLDAMPRLRAVLYGAGSVRGFVTPELFQRGIVVSNAACANAGPTAAFAEAMIVLALKQAWFYLRERRVDWAYLEDTESSGLHGATVGIVGLGRVAREVIRGLQRHAMTILVSDPTIGPEEAARVGGCLVSLDDLFSRSDVVSVHAPSLPQTAGMITGGLLRRMKRHATFVNTARGAIVREADLATVLQERPDLTALLDVTDPEPAPADSPLRALPNVVITPHLAGARHRDIELIGRVVLDELDRYALGQPLRFLVDPASETAA